MKAVFISLRSLIFMTLLLGGAYPLFMMGIGKILFADFTQGSLESYHGHIVGSNLIGQKFSKDEYFWGRSTGPSQLSATSLKLKNDVLLRMKILGENAPNDLIYASASGLDPHISIEAANFQKERVMSARGMSEEAIKKLIHEATEERFLGFMGQPRVNVLKLNLSLDGKQRF